MGESTVGSFGVISDDPYFAAEIASFNGDFRSYFPIISLPRMERNDWELDVMRRVIGVRKSGIKHLVCQSKDYGLLAPLRSKLGDTLIPIDTPDELGKYLQLSIPDVTVSVAKTDYREGLLFARKMGKRLQFNSADTITPLPPDTMSSESVMLVERTDDITDIAAINFALTEGYDIRFFSQPKNYLDRWHNEDIFKGIFRDLSSPGALQDQLISQLRTEIEKVVGISQFGQYRRIQFVVCDIPYGLLLDEIPVAHLFHLDSDLRYIDHLYKSDSDKEPTVPSIYFVDTESPDLVSEIPAIEDKLINHKYWSFHLNGINATRSNLNLALHFYPFDIMVISGHGSAPECREVVYGFQSRKGTQHTGKFLEYFQFGKVVNDKIEVERKFYPLAFDDIPWRNKEELDRTNRGHLFREFFEAEQQNKINVISSTKRDPRSIEGLLLSDGVFLGNVRFFSTMWNPVLLLNTCGSLLEIGENLSLAGAKACIGTMWSIADLAAQEFAGAFFSSVSSNSLVDSFASARLSVKDKSSRMSYAFLGLLGSSIVFPEETPDIEKQKSIFGNRLLKSIRHAVGYFEAGWLSHHDILQLLQMYQIAERFEERDMPGHSTLRSELSDLRTRIASHNQHEGEQ